MTAVCSAIHTAWEPCWSCRRSDLREGQQIRVLDRADSLAERRSQGEEGVSVRSRRFSPFTRWSSHANGGGKKKNMRMRLHKTDSVGPMLMEHGCCLVSPFQPFPCAALVGRDYDKRTGGPPECNAPACPRGSPTVSRASRRKFARHLITAVFESSSGNAENAITHRSFVLDT